MWRVILIVWREIQCIGVWALYYLLRPLHYAFILFYFIFPFWGCSHVSNQQDMSAHEFHFQKWQEQCKWNEKYVKMILNSWDEGMAWWQGSNITIGSHYLVSTWTCEDTKRHCMGLLLNFKANELFNINAQICVHTNNVV